MRHQVLFIQGGGANGTHDDWDLKLVESLRRELGPGYEVLYPRMPDEANPSYAGWKAALEKELAKLHDGAILLGHSIGGAILINALGAQAPAVRLRGVFLVAAPFVGTGGWPAEDFAPVSDLGARLPAQVPVFLYHGSEDDTVPLEHVRLYANAIPQAVVRRLNGRNHQLNEDLSEVAADIRRLE
jgi:predicted alpha/beta hydrolase family esterase